MKILYLILSIYIVVLSTKPCCADNDCQSKVSQKIEMADSPASQEKGCPGCSPFFICCSCAGFIVAEPFTITQPVINEDQIKHPTGYQPPYVEKVVLSLWLPPKIS